MTAQGDYWARFRRVLDHIDAHLEEDLSLERLSGVAAYSKFHFHRQFSALYGLAVHRYVQLLRLQRATQQLAFRTTPIIDVALGSGYESHEAFARAFKKAVGQTPSEFRAAPQWASWRATFQPVQQLRSTHMTTHYQPADVRIVDFPATRVATLRHHGDPQRLDESIRKFIDWRRQNQLPPHLSATFNIALDNPHDTPPESFRYDLCAATLRPIPENPAGVFAQTIPASRCAVLRHQGPEDSIGDAVTYLYATWLPASGEDPGDFPLFFQRHLDADVSPGHTTTDVFLPLQGPAL